MSEPSPLLAWVERLAAVAQSGLTFDPGPYDRQRYEEVRRIAAEMAAWPGGSPDSIEALFAGATGYATPKIVVRAAVVDEGRLLMVRETVDGLWTVPGGWVDVGESPSTAVVREVREESGYEVEVVKLAAVYDKLRHPHPPVPHHSYILGFVCDLVGGEPVTSVETSEVGWFSPDDLPELSTHRATEGQLRALVRHALERDLPTDFD